MPKKKSSPDTTPPEIDNGTIDSTIDDACMAAAVAAQTEVIEMLARLILLSLEKGQQQRGTSSGSSVRSATSDSAEA